MSDVKPRAFEVAVIAAILSLRHPSSKQPPENWLESAHRLLAAAEHYEPQPSEKELREWVLEHSRIKSYPFDSVLMEIEAPKAGKKKGRTMVGSITTQKGLLKAVRRVLPEYADEIIKLGALYGFQIDAIVDDQARWSETRTAAANKSKSKRVKRNR